MITDNNHLAAALLVTLPLMNYLRLHSRERIVRIGLAAAMGLTLLATVASYSRGALLGLAAVSAFMWWKGRRKVVGAVLLLGLLAGGVAFVPEKWVERMETITEYQADASASERLVLWGISLRLALDRPLTGSGFTGPYDRGVVDTVEPGGPARAVHSIWFELLGENGFVALFVWSLMIAAGMVYAIRLDRMARGRPDLAWAGDLGRMTQVSIIAYVVAGSFLSLSYWDFFWTLLVVAAAAHAIARRALAGEESVIGWRARTRASAPMVGAGATA